MALRLTSFLGEVPRLVPRALPDAGAQVARNVRMNRAALIPLRDRAAVTSRAEPPQTIYKHQGEWMSWPGVVNVAPAPIAEDRLYVTGDGKPKLIYGGQTYDLAVPYPAGSLSVSVKTDDEYLFMDGVSFRAINNTSGTTASGHYYTVSVEDRKATVTVYYGNGITTTQAEDFVNTIGYRNDSPDLTKSLKVFSLTRLMDNGGTDNEGRDTTTLYYVSSTVRVNGAVDDSTPISPSDPVTDDTPDVNDPPTLTTTPLNPTYSVGQGLVPVFSNTSISTIEAGQSIIQLTFTVDGLVNGSAAAAVSETVLYAYTYVTSLGEESEPSAPSNALLWSPGLNVIVSGFQLPPGNRLIDKIRIYRSQTSASGTTDYFFIAEMAPRTADWLDMTEDNPIQEAIPSRDFNAPPDSLRGLISMPNGMMAAFTGKQLYFCEPYIPHAWPEKYVLTTDHAIVGLGAFGSSLAIMTDGPLYLVQGTSPDSMSMEKLEINAPCVSARGIVDLGYTIAYPSNAGLVTVSSAGPVIATAPLFTEEQWSGMRPDTMVASQYEGGYVARYSYLDAGGALRQGTLIVDLSGREPYVTRTRDIPAAFFHEAESGKLFFVEGNTIFEWNAAAAGRQTLVWRSKLVVLNSPTNFGCVLVESDEEGFGMSVRVYADGTLRATHTDLNKVCRLPSGFLARTWEIEVEGTAQINAITLAQAPNEISTL